MDLSKFPRTKLANLPTPIEKLENLSKLFGVNMFVKRDDETGLAGGGNKVRKLEFLIGDAIAKGADTIITVGAVQSNHVRQTAAAAAKAGLKCRAVLERRIEVNNPRYEITGNVLLDHLFGTPVRYVKGGADLAAEMNKEVELVKAAGGKPYIIPGGGSNFIGALGYMQAAEELITQSKEMGVHFEEVVVTSGSSGTHAGLAAGFTALNHKARLTGISIRQKAEPQKRKVKDEVDNIASIMGFKSLTLDEILVEEDYIGEGYGILNECAKEAIVLAARHEGLILDPVYTGKAFAGMLGLIRNGTFKKGSNILFMHTGGSFALFAYENEMMEYINAIDNGEIKIVS